MSALTVCSTDGCPRLTPRGKCDECRRETRREADKRRPNATDRGYGPAWRRKRAAYLAANPACVDCGAPATVADHDPLSRRELLDLGVEDPDADEHLKARCAPCHDKRTGHAQPGGWNRR